MNPQKARCLGRAKGLGLAWQASNCFAPRRNKSATNVLKMPAEQAKGDLCLMITCLSPCHPKKRGTMLQPGLDSTQSGGRKDDPVTCTSCKTHVHNMMPPPPPQYVEADQKVPWDAHQGNHQKKNNVSPLNGLTSYPWPFGGRRKYGCGSKLK